MSPEDLRDKAKNAVEWFRQHQAELQCAARDLEGFSSLVDREFGRDFGELEPRPALLSAIQQPRRLEALIARGAPAIVLQEAKAKASQFPANLLRLAEKKPAESIFFEALPKTAFQHGSLSFRYRSYWDEANSRDLDKDESLEGGWASIDFSARYLDKLALPEWKSMWAKQKALIESHACEELAAGRIKKLSVEALQGLLNKTPMSEGFSWSGMLETPFFLGRLAKMLGRPPEAWGGGSYAVAGTLDGEPFSAVATESHGHGIRHISGSVGHSSEADVAAALEAFVGAILADFELADTQSYCFHYERVFVVGVRKGKLLEEPVTPAPFWIDAFWGYGA